tara:strand:+ start:660 stop:1019 length:360 start_codon:yes stop_codon:yes gene_type:complete
MDYVVYAHIAKDIEGYAYIGMGNRDRPRSSWRRSDKRHVELIENGELEVKILGEYETKDEAFLHERHLIKLHQPHFNRFMYHNSHKAKPSSELTPIEIKFRKIELAAFRKRRALKQQTV